MSEGDHADADRFRDRTVDLADKAVLVTGGTGSFGKRFVRTVLERNVPRKMIVYSRDELKQYHMQNALRSALDAEKFARLRFFIGDVRDLQRLRLAMNGVDLVIHAAALKQVTTAEYNPMECIKTNLLGADNVINAALAERVERVLALSSDKACNPINLYGATKLAADKSFVAANNLAGTGPTRFSVVRYGNVLASRGSVVEQFRQIAASGGDHLPITDRRMTRFWITLGQGVDFVLSSLKLTQGGEIFVPKIASMRTIDLAAAVAPGLPTREVGVRPGEKLHEMMFSEDDARSVVEFPDRYAIEPSFGEFPRTPLAELFPGARPVPDRFRYASDTNSDWLTRDCLLKMLADSDEEGATA